MPEPDRYVDAAEFDRRSRRSLLVGGLAAMAGYRGWRWVMDAPADGNIPAPIRGGLEWNEAVWSANYSAAAHVPTFDVDDAEPLRVNGVVGMEFVLDLSQWSLLVTSDVDREGETFTLDDIRSLGEVDLVMEHRCIEGWSSITHWTGVPFTRLADPLFRKWGLGPDALPYVGIVTVGGGYYVGLDTAAAMHPQVLLGTGLDGEPLAQEHGAPLRLVSPIHYGTKSIKRIGHLHFGRERPRDYWAERGYDWHSQH